MDKFVGKRLDGRYEIREIIGVGGMAVVYKAYDCIEDRIVAVKILKEEFISNEEFISRFKNESKAIAVLNHPNIVKVYDVSFGDLIQYIVMEYVDGVTLKEYINKQGSLRWKDAVYLTIQVLRALQHAHDKGIVHRDVKPQNIMLLADGTIKVTDFGIARFARSEHKTMTDKAIGSVHYISPEQAKGEATDEKADIYSVGVMLYEMLTGKLPFEAESAVSVAIMQLQKDPVLPREINNTIPVGLEQITMHAMQKDVAKRYRSAAEMLRDLEEFRRSPEMVFDYTYFVDDEPTRFVDVVNSAAAVGGTAYSINNINNIPEEPASIAVNTGNYIDDSDDDDEDDDEIREKSPVIPILAGVAIAFIIVAAIIAFLLYRYLGTKTEGVTVPNFVGLVYEDIMKDSRYSDFNLNVQYEYNDSVPKGEIISQSFKEGRNIKLTEEIVIVVSNGPEMVQIPKVDGLNIQDAKMQLDKAYLKYKEIPQPSENVAKDCVITTNPVSGYVPQGETIDIYVSTGPDVKYGTVGSYVKLTEEAAKQLIEKNGFKVGEVTYKDSTAEKGYVIEQSVAASTILEKNTTIDLVVSTGVMSYDYKLIIKEDLLDLNFKDEYKDMTLSLIIDGTTIETTSKFDANVREGEFEFNINSKTTEITAYINIKFDNGETLKNAFAYTIDMANGTIKKTVVSDSLDPTDAESKYLVYESGTPDDGSGDGTGNGGTDDDATDGNNNQATGGGNNTET